MKQDAYQIVSEALFKKIVGNDPVFGELSKPRIGKTIHSKGQALQLGYKPQEMTINHVSIPNETTRKNWLALAKGFKRNIPIITKKILLALKDYETDTSDATQESDRATIKDMYKIASKHVSPREIDILDKNATEIVVVYRIISNKDTDIAYNVSVTFKNGRMSDYYGILE